MAGTALLATLASVAVGAGSAVYQQREARKAEGRQEEAQRRAELEARLLAAAERQAASRVEQEQTDVQLGEDEEEQALVGRRQRGRLTAQPALGTGADRGGLSIG